MIDPEHVVRTFMELARIDSPSGHEDAIATELEGRFRRLGFDVRRDPYGNLIASEPGDSPLILSAHMDTVEPGRGIVPKLDGDRIVSDGTTILGGDCKAGITAILEGLQSIAQDGIARIPVEVVLTRDEERGLIGAKRLDFEGLRGREAVVFDGEGSVRNITSSSPTYLSFDIDIVGRAAHAGVEPEKGLSAIRIAAEVVSRLPQGRLDDATTFNVGMISGGSVRNAVPEHSRIRGEARSRDQATLGALRTLIEGIVSDARGEHPDARLTLTFEVEFETYEIDPEAPNVRRVTEALLRLGLGPLLSPSGGGTDGNVFRSHGIAAVVVGVAAHDAHTVREYVVRSELVQAAEFCGALLVTSR